MSDPLVAEASWAADMLYGPEPSSAPPTETKHADDVTDLASNTAESVVDGRSVELDPPATEEPDQPDVDARAKRTAVVLGAGLICAIGAITAALVTFRESPPIAQPAPQPPVVSPASPTQGTAFSPVDSDRAIPFTASANCPPGSTSAQALTDTTSDSAWVCVRGSRGATVDGQVLHVDFGHSYVLSAVSVTAGWIAKTPGGKDEWLQHRAVTRLQYMFNDTDRTIVTQDTANTHGPVTTALPRKIMASAVTVVILRTSRPPASPLPTVDPNTLALPGFGESMLGSDGAPLPSDAASTTQPPVPDEQDSDPVDATFAMSELKFLGHEPN